MTDIRQETIDTYNKSAKALAHYFRGIGSRVEDIELGFELAGNPNDARVVEIGCGDGRDAKEIIKKCDWFLGIDISEELIKLAREHVPNANFEVADATTLDYPKQLDIVFAFASLLHLDKNEIKKLMNKIHNSLKPSGIFYISLKYSALYEKRIKEDQYGKRLFYFYNPELIENLAGEGFRTIKVLKSKKADTEWFEIALQNLGS